MAESQENTGDKTETPVASNTAADVTMGATADVEDANGASATSNGESNEPRHDDETGGLSYYISHSSPASQAIGENAQTDAAPVAESQEPPSGTPTAIEVASASTSTGKPVSKRGGRGGKRASFLFNGQNGTNNMPDVPPSTTRGRGPGRPRGRGRGGGRGGSKRKREDRDEEENANDDSESDEIYTPTNLITKSGRSIQKPTSFVPPPTASPIANPTKRKRTYRRNPESAVCKICLRGVSPATNMIVFCDGCNTPYHRYCHHPPIDQSVIEEVEKEWFCKQCERERIEPVPVADVEGYVAAEGVREEERQRYFSSLTPGMLVTLLTRATTLKPDLPLFPPDYHRGSTTSNGGSHVQSTKTTRAIPSAQEEDEEEEEEEYGSEEHPPHYPRPGQGLMASLPPDREDAQFLVDEENSAHVFAHLYQVDPKAAGQSVSSGGAAAAQATAGAS